MKTKREFPLLFMVACLLVASVPTAVGVLAWVVFNATTN